MKLFKNLYPDLVYDKINDIDLEMLRSKGIKAFILDIDNTLVVPHTDPDENAVSFVNKLKEKNFKVIIVSNNIYERAERFAKGVGCGFVCDKNKPSKKPFISALGKINAKAAETAVVGDQLFTDVLGGNRMKMTTILVSPVTEDKEFFVRLKRMAEKPFLKKIMKNKENF